LNRSDPHPYKSKIHYDSLFFNYKKEIREGEKSAAFVTTIFETSIEVRENKVFNTNKIIGTNTFPWETSHVKFNELETSTYHSIKYK